MKELMRKLGCVREGYCTSQRRLDGKTVVITGGNAGIGIVTASFLWRRGADVVITCRDASKGEAALKKIKEDSTPEEKTGSLRFVILDLASLESVRSCAQHLISTLPALHILINNAGVMMPPFGLTEDGFELQFGTNYLGHFLFTLLLMPKILESAPARIINVSSVSQSFYKELDLETMNDPERYYALHAYFRSKAALVMFSRELAKRLEGCGVNVYSLDPGYIYTNLYKYGNVSLFPGFLGIYKYVLSWLCMKNTWQGSQTTIHCAICEKTDNQTALFYEECRPREPNKICKDEQLCQDLWRRSLDFVSLGQDYELPIKHSRSDQLSSVSD